MKRLHAIVAAAFCFAGSAHASVISNGNFENGLAGWSASGNVGLGVPVYFGAGSAAQDGTELVAFNLGDSAPNGTLSQSFATVAGTTYTVSFAYGLTSCGSCTQQLNVAVVDAASIQLGSLLASSSTSGALGSYGFSFVADGASATLRFADVASNPTVSLDGVLDNVAVDAKVPEPASIALFGLGLAGLGVVKRRRTRR